MGPVRRFPALALALLAAAAGFAPSARAEDCAARVRKFLAEVVVEADRDAATRILAARRLATPEETGFVVIPRRDLRRFGKLVALSDVHGKLEEAVALLRSHGLLDERGDWVGGNAVMVVVGDLINKGSDSIGVVQLFRKLELQAAQAGGRVFVTLGNHDQRMKFEAPRMTREFAQSMVKAGLDPEEAVRNPGDIQNWIRGLPLGVLLGDTLFVHSGYVTESNLAGATRGWIANDTAAPDIMGKNGILEAKGWQDKAKRVRKVLDLMEKLKIRRIVFGHQPNAFDVAGVATTRDGRFVKLDTGMPIEKRRSEVLICRSLLEFVSRGARGNRGCWAALRNGERGKLVHVENLRPAP